MSLNIFDNRAVSHCRDTGHSNLWENSVNMPSANRNYVNFSCEWDFGNISPYEIQSLMKNKYYPMMEWTDIIYVGTGIWHVSWNQNRLEFTQCCLAKVFIIISLFWGIMVIASQAIDQAAIFRTCSTQRLFRSCRNRQSESGTKS